MTGLRILRDREWGIALKGLLALSIAVCGRVSAEDKPLRAEITVGVDSGDIRGQDNRVLQAAVDYVAGLGGGTVHIAPGRHLMRNALMLRDNVCVSGTPGQTILAVCDSFTSPLARDGDCNQREITVTDPSGFRAGDGVAVSDKNWGAGFCVTTATITEQFAPNVFAISKPLYLDYYASKEGSARLLFPVVSGTQIKNVVVEGLTIEGNKAKTAWLDGCRGGGIYFFESADVTIRNCVVREYNGDGISFQVSENVVVEGCLAENNAGYGLHPGSGSQNPIVRRNRSLNNGSDGMFVCWRVQHGVFEDNELRGNGRDGISIGHKDSDNVFRNNVIAENKKAGVLFRREDEPMGAHRNVFENNRILDNEGSGEQRAAVMVIGQHQDVVFRNNVIGNSKPDGASKAGIFIGKDAQNFKQEQNEFSNLATQVVNEK